jgi:hypothetical protein
VFRFEMRSAVYKLDNMSTAGRLWPVAGTGTRSVRRGGHRFSLLVRAMKRARRGEPFVWGNTSPSVSSVGRWEQQSKKNRREIRYEGHCEPEAGRWKREGGEDGLEVPAEWFVKRFRGGRRGLGGVGMARGAGLQSDESGRSAVW